MVRRSRPSTNPLGRISDGLRDSPVKDWQGRLPGAIPLTPTAVVTQKSSSTASSEERVGAVIVATGDVTIPAGGGDVVSQLVTEEYKVGFPNVAVGGDWLISANAVYRVIVTGRFTDGYRGGMVGQVYANPTGSLRREYRPLPGLGGRRSLFPGVPVDIAINKGEQFGVELYPDDGQQHQAEIEVALTLVELIPPQPRVIWTEPSLVGSGTNARTGWTAGRPSNLAYPTVAGGIQAGDLLLITVSSRYDALPSTPAGFTAIAGPQYGACVFAKTAVGGETGSVSVTYTGWGTFAECSWQMAVIRDVKLPVTDAGTAGSETAPSVSGLDAGLLITAHGGWAASGGYTGAPPGMTLIQNSGGYQGVDLITCMKALTEDGPTGTQTPTFSHGSGSHTAVAATFPNLQEDD